MVVVGRELPEAAAEYSRVMSLMSSLSRPGGPDPRFGSRFWTVVALALSAAAVGVLCVAVSLGRAQNPAADGSAIAAAVVSLAAAVCMTGAAPTWLARFSSAEADSKLIDVLLWALPAAMTVVAAAGGVVLMEQAMLASYGGGRESFLAGGAMLLGSILYVGVASTLWGVRLSVERLRRRRGWRPDHEIALERLAEQSRSVRTAQETIDRQVDPTAIRSGEIFIVEAVVDDPASPWPHLVATDQRLILRGESGWSWREHRDLVGVDRTEEGRVIIAHIGRGKIVVPGDGAGVGDLADYLERVLASR